MPYSFSCIFLRTWLLLIIPFISLCSQLLHAGEFSWMYLLMNSSLLQQLANNVQRYCFLLEQKCFLLDTFFTIKIIAPLPCPRGPVQLTGPRGIFFNFGCIFHQYCQNILEIYESYEILHQNDFAQFFAIFCSSRTSSGTTCSANAQLWNSVT